MSKHLDLMTTISGEPINTVEEWAYFRRPEILSLFEMFVYGIRPCEAPENLTFQQKFYAQNYENNITLIILFILQNDPIMKVK